MKIKEEHGLINITMKSHEALEIIESLANQLGDVDVDPDKVMIFAYDSEESDRNFRNTRQPNDVGELI